MPKKRPLKKPSTAELKRSFLEQYKSLGRVDLAAKSIGVTRATPYAWKQKDKDFASAIEESKTIVAGMLEDEAFRRGFHGVEKPIYQQGHRVDAGEVREYSDTLLIFLLKGLMPEKYRERHDVKGDMSHKHEGGITIYLPDNGRGNSNGKG